VHQPERGAGRNPALAVHVFRVAAALTERRLDDGQHRVVELLVPQNFDFVHLRHRGGILIVGGL
jgi:hypothetical protein